MTDQQINAYTGDGLRAWRQNSSGARTYFVYDGDEPVCELNGSGTLITVNDFGADGVWARHTTTTDWFYTFDPQGCLSQKIGRDESVLCSSIYDAQGHEATTDTHPDPFSGYGGQWGYYADWETSGDNGGSCLYLLGHRFYDPDAGRFINRDPMGYDGGINLYGYTGNNPVNRTDPTGLDFLHQGDPGHHEFCVLLGFGAGLAAGGVVTVTIAGITGGAGTGLGFVAGGAVAGGFGQMITNLCNGDPPQQDVAIWCVAGAIGGAAGPIIGKGVGVAAGAR